MKKLLLSFVAMVFAIGVNAAEVVFDLSSAAAYGYNDPAKGEFTQVENGGTIAKDNVVLTAQYSSGNGLRFFSNTNTGVINLRAYVGATMVFSTNDGSVITDIKIEGSNLGDNYVQGEGYKSGVWAGSAASVSLNVVKSTVQMNKITVTTVDAGENYVAKPTASKASGTYYETFSVELTAAEGADIYYQIDGEGYQKYEAPVAITSSCILEAYAQIGENKSEVITLDYVIELPVGMTLAEAITKEDKAAVEISEEMVVVYKSGQYTYVNAGQAWGLIYGSTAYKAGDVIPVGFKGTISIYNNLVEIVPVYAPESSATASVPMPIEVTDPSALALADMNKYVVFKDATVDAEAKTLSIDGKSVTLYKRFNECPLPDENGTFAEVLGFVSVYKTDIQVYPTEFNGGTSAISSAIVNGKLSNSQCFNLAGQKVSKAYKGIVLENGKKIIK